MSSPRSASAASGLRTRHLGLITSAAVLATLAAGGLAFEGAASAAVAQPPVALGSAGTFAVLAGSGITNTGPTTVNRDVGTFPTPTETGFGSVTFAGGSDQAGDALTQGAKQDLLSAYNDAAGRTPATSVPVELGGTTLPAGVYTDPSFGLTGTLTLDAQGNPDAEFIFQTGSTITTASNSRVLLINGADACHVVWQIGSSATFGTGTQFAGDVLAHTSITATTGATFRGRLLASDGAVTLDTNTITAADCATTTPPATTTTPVATSTAPVGVTTTPVGVTTTPVAVTASPGGATTAASTTGKAPAKAATPGSAGAASGRSPLAATGSNVPSPPGSTTSSGSAQLVSSTGRLPYTGAPVEAEITMATAMLLSGGLLVIAGRRRRKA